MRKLTAKQKKLLTAEWKRLVAQGVKNPDSSDIPANTYLAIDNINPCEIYWQNVNRLFDDLNMEN